jgi:hypothetical protein
MNKLKYIVLTAVAAVVFTACGAPTGNAPANNANAANTAAKPAAAAPSKEDLIAGEEKAWKSWQAKDGKFFEDYLTDNAIGMGNNGRSDKAAIIKRIGDPTCDVNDFSFSDEQLRLLGADAALLTYKAMQDAKCGGKALPATVRAATVLVRSGDKWKAAFHAEAAIVDQKAAPAKPADEKAAPKKDEVKSAAPDAITDALVPAEKAIWEAWKDHDGKRLEDLTTKDISFINIFGTFFATKADALKDWTSPGCDVKSVSITDAVGTTLSPTACILTFSGGADGTCFGQKVGPIWGSSIYVKDGDTWKWTFGINLPAH